VKGRPLLLPWNGRPMPWARYRLIVAAGRWRTWRLRHPLRKSPLQRDFESGDPARLARVHAAARQILAQLADEYRACARCGDQVRTLSSRDWCDGCEAEEV
jgi:hypothetical protein